MLYTYQSVYPNLEHWVIRHLDGNWTELARRAGVRPSSMYRIAIGVVNPHKESIDKILKATGLTYEEAFYEPN